MQAKSTTGTYEEESNSHASEGSVVCELKKTLSDIEKLIQSSNSYAGNDLIDLNEKIKRRINLANESFGEKKASLVHKLRDTSMRTNNYVHDQPWKVIGAGVAIGAICGILLAAGKAKKQS